MPAESQKATLLINKTEAARRQIDAAIRMTLMGEDALAIHTVAAAAYNIVRDLKSRRGKSELTDIWSAGLFVSAKEHADAVEQDRDPQSLLSSYFGGSLKNIADGMKQGNINHSSDINITISNERSFWVDFVKGLCL